MNLKISWALLFSFSLLCLNCTHKTSRAPAGRAKLVITDEQIKALAEIFGTDSPANSYRHPMRVNFYTNRDKKYLSETAKKALQEALLESLGGEVPEQGLGKAIAGNLKNAMIENFVKTMRIYKIINTGLQVDLSFVPQANNRADYDSELSSNQLVRLSETGKLAGKWDSLESSTITESLYNNSVYIPSAKGEADYIGGIVSFYVEILDTTPGYKIPSITKNGVKGFFRYRRYYRVNKDVEKSMNCDKFAVNFKRSASNVPLFYTVDLYKNFNLKNMIPTAETIEVFPGLLATTSAGRPELMPTSLEKVGKSIPTATFVVDHKGNFSGDISFSLKKLVYDLKDKSLDRENSEVDLVNYYSHGDGGLVEQESALANARRTFFKKCEKSIEKLLGLESLVQGGTL